MRSLTIDKVGVSLIFALLCITINSNAADKVCAFKLSSCPESFGGDTIYVPKNVTQISPEFFVCEPEFTIEEVTETGNPPSIMFIIDHSTSMTNGGGGSSEPMDSGGVRFKVTSALLDSIYKIYPDAEVGLTIFEKYLWINAEDNPNYASLPESYYETYPISANQDVFKTQGYIPLLKLDSTVQGGKKGIDVLKDMLEVKHAVIGSVDFESAVPVYEPKWLPDLNGGTNINVAFDATNYAMQKASYPKENQFVIFLSDGVPTVNWPRNGDDFRKGTGMPTTFTVYFNHDNSVPEAIRNMTSNIQKNAYSSSNELSWYYGMEASYDSLLNKLMTSALNPIMTVIKQKPTQLKINGIKYTDYREADSIFFINGGLKLNDSITKFNMEISYRVRKDTTSAAYDSIVNTSFTVNRTDTKAKSDGIDIVDCRDTTYFSVSVNAVDPVAQEENTESGLIEIRRVNQDYGDLTVYFEVSGTATKNADYASILYDSIVFTKGVSVQSVEIKPYKDVVKEKDETVIITLLSSKKNHNIRYVISGPDSAVVMIKDTKLQDTTNIAVLINPFSTIIPITTQLKEVLAQGIISNNVFGNLKEIVDAYKAEFGTFVYIETTIPLKTVGIGEAGLPSYGKGLLYDAIGNLIKKLDVCEIDTNKGIYGVLWDGTNKKHRKVGGGVYLLTASLFNKEEPGNPPVKMSYKIGVRD